MCVCVCVCVHLLLSFPQQLKTEADYFVRTDDGEAICLYIEAFQKDPEAALVSNPTHPPSNTTPQNALSRKSVFVSVYRLQVVA